MKTNKIPMRTCVVSHEKLPKKDLLRIVKNKDGEILLDLTGKQNGRGVYLKKDTDVILKAKQNKILDRCLEANIPDTFYDKIIEQI